MNCLYFLHSCFEIGTVNPAVNQKKVDNPPDSKKLAGKQVEYSRAYFTKIEAVGREKA